ncbi:MAG: ribosome maturation factor RimP [Defluviitaleaceae bacterium]|nr:ribosome maturation factor RimP [Defluviitaleaceae bacterium]
MSTPKLEHLTNLLTPVVEAQGVSLYDLEFIKEGTARILRLYIDKEPGVDLEDCERVSRAADAVLDEHDPIEQSYYLEVSSPGVERKLSKPEHFMRYTGHKIALRLYGPLDGRRKFTGQLTEYTKETLTLTEEDGTIRHIPVSQIGSCKLMVFD